MFDLSSCLLGRSDRFPHGFFSCISGFLESGESIEDGVRREVAEETGVEICGEIEYQASQAFPFPSSLMLGCVARATLSDDGKPLPEIDLRDGELSEARWFTKKEIAQVFREKSWKKLFSRGSRGLAPGEIAIPPPPSVANRMLHAWVRGRIPLQPSSRL